MLLTLPAHTHVIISWVVSPARVLLDSPSLPSPTPAKVRSILIISSPIEVKILVKIIYIKKCFGLIQIKIQYFDGTILNKVHVFLEDISTFDWKAVKS